MHKYGSVIGEVQDDKKKAPRWRKDSTFIREEVGLDRDKWFEESPFREVENENKQIILISSMDKWNIVKR